MKQEKNTNHKLGFTLLELLVVVLIIGILAAIALPQYQMAVGKARFATLKNITKSIQESAQRYYMVHGTYDLAAKNLDIDLNITSGADSHSWFTTGDGISCNIWNSVPIIACGKTILGNQMRYYVDRETGKPKMCFSYSIDKTDKSNKLCQKETGKTANLASCYISDGYCSYYY